MVYLRIKVRSATIRQFAKKVFNLLNADRPQTHFSAFDSRFRAFFDSILALTKTIGVDSNAARAPIRIDARAQRIKTEYRH
jgi:hypothetical protein